MHYRANLNTFAEDGSGPRWWTFFIFLFLLFYFVITVSILEFQHEPPEFTYKLSLSSKTVIEGTIKLDFAVNMKHLH